MEQVILEVMKDSGRRAEYRVFNNLVIRIGRGYDNDLILTDPYVSERHCTLRSHEGGFILEDEGSLNGTWLLGHPATNAVSNTRAFAGGIFNFFRRRSNADDNRQKVEARVVLRSGDHILVGQTRLKFFIPSHEVGPARPIVKPSAFFEAINRSWKAWGLVSFAVAVSVVIEHQESYRNLSASKFVSVGIGLILMLVVWTGIWAFIGWIVKRRAFFNAHLSCVTLFFLWTAMLYPVAEHLGYSASSQGVEMLVGAVIFWITITALISGHLAIATLIPRFYQGLWGGLISLVIVVFGIVSYYAGQSEFNPQPQLYSTLIPPYGRLGPSQTVDQFIKASEEIFEIKINAKQ